MEKKAIHRIFEYLEQQGIPHTRFEKEVGLSNGYLNTARKRAGDLGEGILKQIIDNCLQINPTWLITGNGPMLKTDYNYDQASEATDHYNAPQKSEHHNSPKEVSQAQAQVIESQKATIEAQTKTIASLEEQVKLLREKPVHKHTPTRTV